MFIKIEIWDDLHCFVVRQHVVFFRKGFCKCYLNLSACMKE